MPPTRIGHKKSRFGCIRCKQRHVKCDEQRPCANCVRHQAECSLILSTLSPAASAQNSPAPLPRAATRIPQIHSASGTPNPPAHSPIAFPTPNQTSSVHSQHSNTVSPNPRASSIKAKVSSIRQALLELTDEVEVLERNQSSEASNTLPQTAEPSNPKPLADSISTADWLGDIHLFSHYMSSDCLGLAEYHRGELWRDILPQLAFTRESLMHGILALSALHLASLHPDRKREYTAQSARHQEVALSRLRTGLFDTTEENCFEHFILAYLVILFTFYSIGNPLVDDDDNDNDTSSPTTNNNRRRRHVPLSLHELGQTLFLGQGIFNTISSPETWTWLQRGPLAALFANARHKTPTAANLPPDTPGTFPHRLARLAELVARIGGSPAESRARASCMVAVDGLRRAFGVAVLGGGGRAEASPVWVWLTLLPPDFREHVGREHPVALVVLAHYAAILRCFEDRWYLAGWSARVLGAIEEALERRGPVGDGGGGGGGGGGDAGGERWGEWLEYPKAFGAAELDEAIRQSEERRERGVE